MTPSPAGPNGEAYQALFENSLDAVFFTAPDGRVFAANPAACAMFGYTEKELCALGREGISDPADRERAAALVAKRAATGQLRGVMSFRRRDGTTFPGEFSSMIFTDASGEQRTCVILRDMTERAQMEERLADQLRQTQAANEELVSFTSYVSHDLRAPLRAMDGYSRALAEDYGDRLDDTARDYLHRIHDVSQKMAALLHDLLRWSRLGRAELHRVPTDLSALARESADRLRAADPDRHVTFHIANGVAGSADPDLIRTVLDNLLGNAWKYTARQPDPVIEFGATTATGGPVTYFVADNGAGFDPAFASKLFEPFQRLHGAEFPGTGLGLASVRRIVERHGGRVWAEAAVDHGATFSFTLSLGPMPLSRLLGLSPTASEGMGPSGRPTAANIAGSLSPGFPAHRMACDDGSLPAHERVICLWVPSTSCTPNAPAATTTATRPGAHGGGSTATRAAPARSARDVARSRFRRVAACRPVGCVRRLVHHHVGPAPPGRPRVTPPRRAGPASRRPAGTGSGGCCRRGCWLRPRRWRWRRRG